MLTTSARFASSVAEFAWRDGLELLRFAYLLFRDELYLLDTRRAAASDTGHAYGGYAYAGGGVLAVQLTGGPADF